MEDNDISKAINKSSKNHNTKGKGNKGTVDSASIEKMVDTAYAAGLINDAPKSPKKRGRPSKNDSAPQEPQINKKTPSQISEELKRSTLILKLSQYKKYFYDICGQLLDQIVPDTLSVEDLQLLCNTCEESVNISYSVMTTPFLIKTTLSNIEPYAISIGEKYPPTSSLNKLKHLRGFTDRLNRDPDADFNIKRISIQLGNLLPSNPYLGLFTSILRTGMETIRHNETLYHMHSEMSKPEINREYSDL